VTRLAKQLIAYLLLLCLSATVIPLNLLHHHEEAAHCDNSDPTLENDPCHVSQFHAHDQSKTHCSHEGHVGEVENRCEFCRHFSSVRYQYVSSTLFWSDPALLRVEHINFVSAFLPERHAETIFSRGPPA
jgi:hypothetical protein